MSSNRLDDIAARQQTGGVLDLMFAVLVVLVVLIHAVAVAHGGGMSDGSADERQMPRLLEALDRDMMPVQCMVPADSALAADLGDRSVCRG